MNKTSMWRVNNKRTHLILPAVPYVNQQFTDIYIPYNIRTLTTTVCVHTWKKTHELNQLTFVYIPPRVRHILARQNSWSGAHENLKGHLELNKKEELTNLFDGKV